MRSRPAAIAGTFYPSQPRQLADDVRGYLADGARRLGPVDAPPKALIAPHAGFVYSGPIAGTAYAAWAGLRDRVERVVLLGPAHRVYVEGLAAPTVDAFETPLGAVPIDRRALDAVADLPQVVFDDRVHAREHALEVQLPFLQVVLGDFALVPFAVGRASAGQVGAVLDRLWGGPETRIVISSDLSHFHNQSTAQALDRATADAIVSLDASGLGRDSACGRVPISGLLDLAERRALRIDAVDLRTSADTAGSPDRVVGYGAFVVEAGR